MKGVSIRVSSYYRLPPAYADQLMLYGQLVGSWDIHSTNFQADGTRIAWQGEWHFAWILGGRGLQDVLLATGASVDAYGTTLRCYDDVRDVWHVSWMVPGAKEFVHLVGRKVGERIVQEVIGTDPHRVEHWIFSDITPQAFTWRDEVSFDQGSTWRLEQEIHGVRRMTTDGKR